MNQLHIRTETTSNGAGALIPEVDGTSLITLVGSYEATRGYDPAGEYDGLVPEHFDFGDLSHYYLGTEATNGQSPAKHGCWGANAEKSVAGRLPSG